MRRLPFRLFEAPILGGVHKGKKIHIPDIATTRSSKAILRESLFDTVQFEIADAPFVEVFAGSGSVGLEALSRGARHGYFIEKNRDVFLVLQENIRRISSARATAIAGDSFVHFPPLLQRLAEERAPAYFYFDPPFSIRKGMEAVYDRTLALIASIDPLLCKKVIIEHMTRWEFPERIGSLYLEKQKRFGKSSLSYYVPILPA